MECLGKILPQALTVLGLQQRYKSENVLLHWREIVGEKIADHTSPSKLQRGVLTVVTNNAVWAHHLMTSKEDIINKINVFCSEKVINDIKFQAGYLVKCQNEENTDIDLPVINWKQAVLDGDDFVELDKTIQPLSDERLRQKARKLMSKDLALQKVKKNSAWHNCKSCGVLCLPEAELCTVCNIEWRSKNKDSLRELLMQAPWLDYLTAVKYVKCHSTEFNTVKNEIIDRIGREILNGTADKLRITTLVMLINMISPHLITDEIITNTLEKIRGKRNVFTSGS